MKIKQIFIMIILLALPFGASGESANQKPILILYNNGEKTIDLNDLSTIPVKSNRIIYHMLQKVMPERYNIPLKLSAVSWSRGLELIEKGFADGIVNASYNEARAKYAVYPMKDGKHNPAKQLKSIQYSLYKNRSSTIQWDGTEITNIDGDIGAVKSYAIVRDLRKMGVPVKEFQIELKIMKDVAVGKLKATAMQDYIADEHLKLHPLLEKNLVKLPIPLKKKVYYLIFSKKFYRENQLMAEKIWDKIEEYSASTEYQRLKQAFEK